MKHFAGIFKSICIHAVVTSVDESSLVHGQCNQAEEFDYVKLQRLR